MASWSSVRPKEAITAHGWVFSNRCGQKSRKTREKTGTAIEDSETLDTDLIGHGGYAGPVIGHFTGYKASSATIWKWKQQDPTGAATRLEKLLTGLTAEHRIVVAATHAAVGKKIPIPNGHFYAMLFCDANRHMVRVFNPWGNTHKPAGPPGLENGYVTEHGFFEVPTNEFVQIFSSVEYETQTPFKN